MPIDDRTPQRNLPLPNAANRLSEDVVRLRQAFAMVGVDLSALFTLIASKADNDHPHAMSDITGLIDALAGKLGAEHTHALADLSDVDLTGAANNMVVMRQAAEWIPVLLQIGHIVGLEAALSGKASHADISNAIAALVNGSGATLDTLKELADAIGSDPNFAATMATALGNRLRLDAAQAFSDPQKAQGRANMGVLTLAEGIAAGADTDLADTDLFGLRRADGSIVKRSLSAVKSLLNTYFKGLASIAVAAGDLIVGTGANTLGRLAAGANGFVLTMVGDAPAWAAAQFGSGMNVQTFNSSGTWTKPSGCSWALIELWGGGAGGARSDSGSGAGCGGGGGEYVRFTVPLSALNATEAVSVGAGGAGRSSGGPGLAGGNSSFKGIFARGAPGGASSSGAHDGGGVGAGGNQTAGAPGTANPNNYIAVFGGAGGGGGMYTVGFAGGTSLFAGSGGAGAPGNASPGQQPGGGGGGSSYGTSGKGGDGRVKISCW